MSSLKLQMIAKYSTTSPCVLFNGLFAMESQSSVISLLLMEDQMPFWQNFSPFDIKNNDIWFTVYILAERTAYSK